MEKKFVSLVVYLNNCENSIEPFMDAVVPIIQENFEHYEIICVDDACIDNSVEALHEYVKGHELKEMVSVIHMGFFQGLEAAMNAGRDASIGDFVYEFDDMIVDYEPELIFDLYEKLLTGFDIVSASSDTKMSYSSKLFYKTFNQSRRGAVGIGPETFRIVSRRAINRIKSLGSYIPYRKAVYANCGLNMTTVSYESKTDERRNHNKKHGFSTERQGLALDSFIYFTNLMERVSLILSAAFLVFFIFLMVYTIVDYIVEAGIASGWASMMLIMALGFFGVFALLTIVLKYLSVLLNLIFRKQKYLVADIEKITT